MPNEQRMYCGKIVAVKGLANVLWHEMINGNRNQLSYRQIYNVCDQIVQCEDGSDEAPEVSQLLSFMLMELYGNSTFAVQLPV